MTVISIRQPGYLPYMGFFKKIQASDIFVYLDDVQYERGDWDNRNQIRTSDGSMLLTVPVYNKFGQKLNEVPILNEQNWNRKHLNSIKNNYEKAPFFRKYWDFINSTLTKTWDRLIDLNLELVHYFNAELDLHTKSVRSSELNVSSTGSARLLEICKKLNANVYVSGELGANYLDEKVFVDAGIKVIYEKFRHPIYRQIHGNFIPNMSVIDLLFNEGENSKKILSESTNI